MAKQLTNRQHTVLDAIRQQLLLLTAISLAGAGFIYLMGGNVVAEPRYGIAFWPRLRLGQRARTHLSWLVAIGLALMAWGAWLDLPRTLITPTTNGGVQGSGTRSVSE